VKKNTQFVKLSIRAAFACLLAAGLLDDAAAQSVSFIAGRDFAVRRPGTTNVAPIVQGDFNRDGITDLVNAGGSVLLGNRNGIFQTVVGFEFDSSGPLAVGDFDRDGIPDLVTTEQFEASIRIGIGNGTFQPPARILTLNRRSWISVTVGDFNRDGIDDLAIPHNPLEPSLGLMDILLGNGDGTFRPGQNFTNGAYGSFVTIGDFNGDGSLDLAWPQEPRSTAILLGNGDGTFQPISQRLDAGLGRPAASVVGDFNGDKVQDLAIANEFSNDVQIWLGNGDGSFGPGRSFATADGPNSIAVADLNGDGIQDLAVTDGAQRAVTSDRLNRVSILVGNGDGSFQPARNLSVGSSPLSAMEIGDFLWVVIGDFNGNGIQDLAVARAVEGGNSVVIFVGNGDGSFRSETDVFAGFSRAVGDFNNDGLQDLAVTNWAPFPYTTTGTVNILLGKGDGSFHPPLSFQSTHLRPGAIAVGDFNRDGSQDLVVANQDEFQLTPIVSILFGNGDGTFQQGQDFGPLDRAYSVAVGDFNRDGRQDFAVTRELESINGGRVAIFIGDGRGQFQIFPELVSPEVSTAENSIAIGDFNRDGIQDLAMANRFPLSVSIFRGNGNGTFQPAQDFEIRGPNASLAVGDFNNDGFEDLALSNDSISDVPIVSILFGNGDGSFKPVQEFGPEKQSVSIIVGDFNGDAKQDLVTSSPHSHNITVLLGNGDGTFLAGGDFGPTGSSVVVIGDFNKDGAPDLAGDTVLLNDTEFQKLKVINAFMTFRPEPTTFRTTIDPAACPGFVGTFRYEALLMNGTGSPPLSSLSIQITTLTNGNLLQDSSGGLWRAGAILPVPGQNGFADGVLSPQEMVEVPFVVCLKNTEPFRLLVNVLGTTADSAGSALSGR